MLTVERCDLQRKLFIAATIAKEKINCSDQEVPFRMFRISRVDRIIKLQRKGWIGAT